MSATAKRTEPRVPESKYWPTPQGKLITAAILELIDEKKAALDAERAKAARHDARDAA